MLFKKLIVFLHRARQENPENHLKNSFWGVWGSRKKLIKKKNWPNYYWGTPKYKRQATGVITNIIQYIYFTKNKRQAISRKQYLFSLVA